MDVQTTIAALREIRRDTTDVITRAALHSLEKNLAPDDADAYQIDILGFDTVLSYLSKTNPEALDLILDPVFDTISDGLNLSRRARCRGIPILKVSAPAHIKARYPKVSHVNAYPTHLLAEYFG